jgi:glycerol kinase
VILGIDQGTTSTKAYRAGEDNGAPHLIGRHVHRQIHPQPGWVEHDPAELLQAIEGLIEQAGPCDLVGLANQGETVVAWDAATKRPLHNAIVWQDDRTRPDIERLRAAGVETLTLARAGLPLDAYFSASKLRWLLDHAEGAAALHRAGRLRLGTSDAFFIDCLTGCFVTDVTTASRTSLASLTTLQWDPDLCVAFGVPVECLPAIVPSAGSFGALHGRPGTRLVASIVDQQAALYGHGCDRPGDVKITFGTGAFALGLAGTTPPPATPGLIATCAWGIGTEPPYYATEASLFTAGAALEWLDRIGMRDGLDRLQPGAGPSASERGVMFVPAQAGLGCPYWDRSARAMWIGMDLATTREQLAMSVLEGVALRAAQMVSALGVDRDGQVRVDGGLSRNAYFVDFLAAALGRDIAVAESTDMTAWGVIRLCRAAAGLPGGRAPRHRRVVPQRVLPAEVSQRFADAVERTRSWVSV